MVQTSPNPNVPIGGQSHPIIPPNQRLPFVSPDTGILTPYGMQFVQQVFAVLQGRGGVFDSIDTLGQNPIQYPPDPTSIDENLFLLDQKVFDQTDIPLSNLIVLSLLRLADPGYLRQLLDVSSGTWIPDLKFGGANVGLTYSVDEGIYVRLGSLVFIEFTINLTAVGASVGAATIGGLPTLSSNINSIGSVTIPTYGNMAAATGIQGYVMANTLLIQLTIPGAAAMANALDTNFTNTSALFGAGFYITG